MRNEKDSSPAEGYVRSLRDPVKRRYARAYLEWITAGRKDAGPLRDGLSQTLALAVAQNLDSLS